MPAGGGPGEDQGGAFDWWAAPEQRVARAAEPAEAVTVVAELVEAETEVGAETGAGVEAEAEVEAEAVGAVEPEAAAPDPGPEPPPAESAAAVYRNVQAGEEFQEIRREYRSFVFPACAAFLVWYLLYIVAAVTLPKLMDQQVAGPFNIAWVLGLLQFASTFLITWLYARHARDRRDRMALGLRWETQDRLR
jgi:uncharacterized membrane protein (DUF485 family)